MSRTLTIACFAIAIAPAVPAAPYWVAWEGNDYPENEGWQRIVDGVGPAQRSLAAGVMTIDGLADRQIDDYYRMERPVDPAPGEQFLMQWRLRVDQVIGNPLGLYDPGVAIFSDDDWTVSLLFGTDFIRSFHEDAIVSVQPGVFHSFDFRSLDMRGYNLYVDGALALTGSFWEPTFEKSKVEWGDRARGSASLSHWDYFRIGVIPEPGTLYLLFTILCSSMVPRAALWRTYNGECAISS